MSQGDYGVFLGGDGLVIDRESLSPVIVRTMCDDWRTITSVIFVTDEHNVVSLWSVEGPTNLVDV
jgi:hypothetical protein